MQTPSTTSADLRRRAFWLGCLAIVLVAAALRVPNLTYNFPYIYHPDEPFNLVVVHDLIRQGTAHPTSYVYPSFFFYLHVPGQLLVKALSGTLQPAIMQSMANTFATQPETFLAGRLTTACIGVATVVAAILLALELGMSRWAALLAGTLAALNPLLVPQSQMMTPDMPSAFFATLALIGAVRGLRTSSLSAYLFGGAMVGLAAASKYNAGLVGVAIATSYLVGLTRANARLPLLEWAATASIATFLLACPYLVLDAYNGWREVVYTLHVYQVGHVGAQGGALQYNLALIWKMFGAAALLVPLAVLHPTRRLMAPVAVFAVLYFAMVSVQVVRFERNLLPIVPALAVFVGAGAEAVLLACRRWVSGRRWRALATVAAILAVAPAAYHLVRDWPLRPSGHSRDVARGWIAEHVSPGASILADSYAPYSDPAVYRVTGATFALRTPRDDLDAYDVVIVARGGSGRLLRNREAPAQAAFDHLRGHACEEREFPDQNGNPQIWVFKLRC